MVNPLSVATDGFISSYTSNVIEVATMGMILAGTTIELPLPPERRKRVGKSTGKNSTQYVYKNNVYKDQRDYYDFIIASSLNKINNNQVFKEENVINFKRKERKEDRPKINAGIKKTIQKDYVVEFNNMVVSASSNEPKISKNIKVVPIRIIVSSSFNKKNI